MSWIGVSCKWCGRFMNKGYIYTPYGTYEMSEPPDDEFICEKCYTPERKKLLSNTWRKPYPWKFNIDEA